MSIDSVERHAHYVIPLELYTEADFVVDRYCPFCGKICQKIHVDYSFGQELTFTITKAVGYRCASHPDIVTLSSESLHEANELALSILRERYPDSTLIPSLEWALLDKEKLLSEGRRHR